jgi:glycosyltransferase involved in cell wall biosynthesis
VIDGATGAIVPVERPDLFAERVLTLLADPDRLQAMGEQAREHVRGLYDERVLLPAFTEFWFRTAQRR